jgi:hypothetical protein
MNPQSCYGSLPGRSSNGRLLIEAAALVAEQHFFAAVAPVAPDEDLALPGEWYLASIGFHGVVAGAVCVSLPIGLARDLWATFVNADTIDDVPDESVKEVVGEFAAMTATLWLTGVATSMAFDLRPPDVVRLSQAPDLSPELMVNMQPLMMGVEIEP